MKILVLTFYFRPDLSAGSFRATALVDAMLERVPRGTQIDVVTTLPNRYQSFSAEAPALETHPGVTIHRIALPKHQSGMADQSKAFLHFAREARRLTSTKTYDLVFATSSRLMTAVLGAWIARRHKAKLYLDIRDLLVDNLKHIVSPPTVWVAQPILSSLEQWALRRADRLNFVSPGFADYFARRYPGRSCVFLTNGIDDEFLRAIDTAVSIHVQPSSKDTVRVAYAGNIGEGQGLHTIVPSLAKRMGDRVHFTIIGDGGRRQMLEDAIVSAHVNNVELRTPVERAELIDVYRQADVLFLHLNAYESFERVLPSKVFEYAAMGKPVWAGVPGYAAKFVTQEIENSAVFRPCDVDDAVRAFDRLQLHDTPRPEFVQKYSRHAISRAMADDVLSLLAASSR